MKYTKEILEEAVKNSSSITGVIRFIGIKISGSTHRHLKQRICHFSIDTSHFSKGLWDKYGEKLSYEKILVNNRLGRRETTARLRRALIESGVLEQCECGLPNIWNGKKLVLQIDHKNGDGLDNRKENLRFLCPNCHSQTANYAVKNSKWYKTKNTKNKTNQLRQTRSDCRRPEKKILEDLVCKKPCSQIAKDFGVSDKSVEKWCKYYEIKKPPRGYWAKIHALRV